MNTQTEPRLHNLASVMVRTNLSRSVIYKEMINPHKFIFGGRLADYKYYDMHQVIGSALDRWKKELQ